MNLLPKSEVNFAKKDYWDTFFKNRNNKEFEWYGEYSELCSQLHKYIKTRDDILMVGCGNSQLSANMYDVGYRKISNIDVSNVAIKLMKQQNKERQEMKFEVMDALDMKFDNEKFTVVLDKGTLDALMPQNSEDDIKRGKGLFAEVARVLKLGGRYVIISLLQSHILSTILDECAGRGWMLRICRCHEVEEKTLEEFRQLRMPVFMVICTKFRKMPNTQLVLELSLTATGKPIRVDSIEAVQKAVVLVQDTTAMCSAVQKHSFDEELEMEYKRDGDATARYTLRVVDRRGPAGSVRLSSYGALIVPHGRETEWMFGTPEGRELLRKSSNFDRLAVIILHRDHEYPSLKEIQNELSSCVKQLAPSAVTSNIPYVTVGDDLGRREAVYKGSSNFSGDFIVEDVCIENDRFRRLIFLNNQAVIQSEAKLKCVAGKKGSTQWVVDSSYVSCAHHCYMAAVVPIFAQSSSRALILGLGGGGLCVFLQRVFPNTKITAVDIDPAIVDVAKNQFGVRENNSMSLEVADGLGFLERCASEGIAYDTVMVDVDSKSKESAMHCPPAEFVSEDTLANIASVLAPSGILALNMVCRLESLKKGIMEKIRNKFNLVARYSLEEDVNEVVYATNTPNLTADEWRKRIETAAGTLNKDGRKKLGRKDNLLDVQHMIKNLAITP